MPSRFWKASGNGLLPNSNFFVPSAAFTYATLDPANKSSGIALSGGNLIATGSTAFGAVRATKSISGKAYWEATINVNADVCTAAVADSTVSTSPSGYWEANNSNSYATWFGSELRHNTTTQTVSAIGGTVGLAIDPTAGKLYVRNSSGWLAGADPVAGTGGLDLTGIGSTIYPAWQGDSGDQITFNFGASSYSYTPPTGYGNV